MMTYTDLKAPFWQTAPLQGGTLGKCARCAVRTTGLCGALRDSELADIQPYMTTVERHADTVLFDENDPSDFVYNLVSGAARSFKLLPDGRRQITGFLRPGDFLGILENDQYAFSADLITDSRLCRFRRNDFEKLVDHFPALQKSLLSGAFREVANAHERFLMLGRKTAQEKVAGFLMSLRPACARGEDEAAVELFMSRGDIADYLGLTIETISRELTKLDRRGLITFQGDRRHLMLDVPGLEDLLSS
ncbi:hypothetical protein CKO24_04010 [Rhodothalassium salexigens DSM 2132]|nr:hypothetical protein [Rhodothalassium salexigens DSM 2132]